MQLQKEVAAWAASHKSEIRRRYDEDSPEYLQTFGDRTIDIARPLVAIAEVSFTQAEIEDARAQLMAAVTKTRFEEASSESKAVQIISALHQITNSDEPLSLVGAQG